MLNNNIVIIVIQLLVGRCGDRGPVMSVLLISGKGFLDGKQLGAFEAALERNPDREKPDASRTPRRVSRMSDVQLQLVRDAPEHPREFVVCSPFDSVDGSGDRTATEHRSIRSHHGDGDGL